MQVKVLFSHFPFGASEHPESSRWFYQTIFKAKADPRISEVLEMTVDDTPITMGRNRVLKRATEMKADVVLMLDSDMHPDLPLPGAKPFWDTAFDFLLKHDGPCAVAAPYCGPPPIENVYVFQPANFQSDHHDVDIKIEQFNREEAAGRAGFEECAALPTGIYLLDMRALQYLTPPYFEYEWADPPFNTEKASTEDVFFTRNLSLAGIPQYVLWDAWAGHYKRKCVGKPNPYTMDAVREKFHEAIVAKRRRGERLVMIGEGEPKKPKPRRLSHSKNGD